MNKLGMILLALYLIIDGLLGFGVTHRAACFSALPHRHRGRSSDFDWGAEKLRLSSRLMRSDIAAIVCTLLILLAGCASQSRTEKRADENEARAMAMRWLQLLDDGDYAEAFEFEAQDFRMYRTQSQFVRLMQARRTWRNSSARRKEITKACCLRPISSTRIQLPSALS